MRSASTRLAGCGVAFLAGQVWPGRGHMCNGRSSSLRCGRSTIDMCPRPGERRRLPGKGRRAGGLTLQVFGGCQQHVLGRGLVQRAGKDGGVRLAVSLHFVRLVQVQLTGQALGVDDRRVAAGAAVAGREVQQGERPVTTPGCSPAASGTTRRHTLGCAAMSARNRNCPAITAGPPTGRRTSAWSRARVIIKGERARVSSTRRLRQSWTSRSTSWLLRPVLVKRMRAYASVRNRPGTWPGAYPASAHAASSRAV